MNSPEKTAQQIADKVEACGRAQWITDAVDIGFAFDGAGWYEITATDKDALKFRNKVASLLRKMGIRVSGFSLGSQLRTKGGIGTGQPHIEQVVTAYGLNASR